MKPNAIDNDSRNPTILIVDDIPANIALLVDYLEEHGYQVVVAQDGEEALQRTEFAHPDLILLDVMMPGMDGFETCQRLMESNEVKETPVIFMTALAETTDKVRGFEVGGIDYVTKPFQLEEVRARINTHLTLSAMRKKLTQQNEYLQDTNRKLEDMHQQLLQAEKLASVGQHAADVVHEIDTPIAFINSNLSTLRDHFSGLLQLLDAYERGDRLLTADTALFDDIRRMRETLDLAFVREDTCHLIDESFNGLQRVLRIVQDLRGFSA